MTMRATANQGWPFPDIDELMSNVNDWHYLMAIYAELRSIQRFTNAADLASKRPTPVNGEMAYMIDTKILQLYDGGTWRRVYPPSPTVLSGPGVPTSAQGAVGDLYVKTT